jgi:hypothetical protein
MAETAKKLALMDQWAQGRREGDQSHVIEDLVRVCRYVVVAFVVALYSFVKATEWVWVLKAMAARSLTR